MGEFIAVGIVLGAVIIAIGFISIYRHSGTIKPSADAVENLARLTVKLPTAAARDIVAELQMALDAKNPGFVEFYENPDRIIRIIVNE